MTAELDRVLVAARAGLDAALAAAGRPADPRWREAFAAVPRDVFVPEFWHGEHGEHGADGAAGGIGGGGLVRYARDAPTAGEREAWARAAYHDCALVTRVEGGRAVSSSSQPSLMGLMLDALGPSAGLGRVLEVGTGTGYNAALMARVLGDEGVVTVDVEEAITAPARERLAAAGFRPRVVTGDGAVALAGEAGSFDAAMVTCEVPRLARAWTEEVRAGGAVLAPVLAGLVRVVVEGPGRAEGRFLPTGAFFVGMRGE
ncbi:methyltransferase domain-containing protein, partial [Mangrovactinospora gilvigrisea]|uniref:methyltransferase domain-containing protein n=1 Tax=Mangrovactinospora gilvigrisea TaxID=1428644 RepID=UPI000B24FC19